MVAFDYLHVLDGRLRIKVAEVRRAPQMARRVEDALRSCAGVREATANPTTGNVLVLYQSTVVSPEDIVRALHALGCLRRRDRVEASAGRAGIAAHVAHALARTTLEMAVQRLVYAIVWAI